jgi:hypothetical protein
MRAGVVICLLVVAVSACGDERESARSDDTPCTAFHVSRSAWDSEENYAEDVEVTERQRIADRIVECNVLRGMSFAEVVDVLGKPDERGRDPLQASYWIGDERSAVQVDSEFLDVTFDAARRVESVEVNQG